MPLAAESSAESSPETFYTHALTSQPTHMLFRVYLETKLIMDGVRLVKGTPEGVALKDDRGASWVLEDVYVAEVEGVAGYITLRYVAAGARGS